MKARPSAAAAQGAFAFDVPARPDAPTGIGTTAVDEPAIETRTWGIGVAALPERGTIVPSTLLVRSQHDPAAAAPELLPPGLRRIVAAWRGGLAKSKSKTWEPAIAVLLANGEEHTLNAIAMLLLGETADGVLGSPIEAALWYLVQHRVVEVSAAAPVLFRRVLWASLPVNTPGRSGQEVTCHACGETWPRDPVLEVECRVCHVRAGAFCNNPSGHKKMGFHPTRELAALAAGRMHLCPIGGDGGATTPGAP